MKHLLMVGALLAASVAGAQETVLDKYLAQAEERIAAGDFAGAERSLRNAAAEPEAGGGPWFRLGRMFEDQNELDNAIEAYGKAGELLEGPTKGEALGRQSLLQEVRGMKAADASAEAAAAADPEGLWPLIALSRARARAGNGDEAAALAEKAIAGGAGVPARVALGFAREAAGDFAAAEQTYSAVRAEDEANIAAGVGLARVLRKADRAAEAAPLLEQVLEVAPGAIEAYKESARVLMALNRTDEAMGQAQIAAALAETDPEAQGLVQELIIQRALGYVAQNQFTLAIQDLTALRDQHPDSAAPRVALAKAYLAQRQVDPAIEELRKAVELAPDLATARFELGRALHAMKRDAAAALPEYEKAVELDPDATEYRTNLGAVLSEVGQAERAIEVLGSVVETPGYDRPEAWIYLGGAYLGAGRYRNGAEALDKALAIVPDNAAANAYVAWCHFGLKNTAAFKKHATRARDLGWQDAALMDRLAQVEAGKEIQ